MQFSDIEFEWMATVVIDIDLRLATALCSEKFLLYLVIPFDRI